MTLTYKTFDEWHLQENAITVIIVKVILTDLSYEYFIVCSGNHDTLNDIYILHIIYTQNDG